MAHIEDRWYATRLQADGRAERVKTALFGKGMRYRVRYIDPDGHERKRSFPDGSKWEAKAFLTSVESDKLTGSYVDPTAGQVKLAVLAEEWLRTADLDESTREAAEYRVRKHVLPYLGDRPVNSIRPSQIRAWDRELSPKLEVATRAVVFAHLSAILTAAEDDGLIKKNPCAAKSVSKPRPPEKRVVPWTAEQVWAVRAGLPERYRAMVDLGAGSGPRQGEVFGLAVEDLDLDDGWWDIRRQVKRVRSRLVFGLPKNDRPRRVPVSTPVRRALAGHLERFHPVEVTLPWEDPSSSNLVTVRLVFTTVRGNAVNRSTFDRLTWHPALVGAGIVPSRATGMHALRHFYASTLLDAGVSVKVLAEYLGHQDPGFTLRVYTHLMPGSDGRARDAIERLFRGDDPDDDD